VSGLIFILSDEHNRDCLGCYGHPLVQTPNLDRLAASGTRFAKAVTNCPICVPARASLATGRYVHDIGNWDNGFPYDGSIQSWAHRLREAGHQVDSIGKLHFRGLGGDHGFSEEHDPLHVVDGVGDILGCVRGDAPFRHKRAGILEAGSGDSTYLRYDASNADRACRWLGERTAEDRPWVLFLSFACPHPPYIAPDRWLQQYPESGVPMPPQWRENDWPDHPEIDYFRRFFDYAEPFEESVVRRLIAAYLGVCSYLDEQIGRVLAAVDAGGLSGSTRILYTSDHGESMGARGLFGKFTLYEESVAVPMILSGPGVPAGKVVDTPVSLVDCYPTVLDAVGLEASDEEFKYPGRSLLQLARETDQDRTVFSEYHAVGSRTASFMLRNRRHKYIHYSGGPPQLFDLIDDPREERDLAADAGAAVVRREFESELKRILDPESVNGRAKADQRAKIEAFGGLEAVVARGAFDNSPVPGEAPKFKRATKP
jgi:choline-sulfatase